MLFRSLWYDRWINTAVLLGVLCATAVLTGALLVGDSMKGSLKALTIDRLGNIDTILFAPNFIDAAGVRISASLGGKTLPVIYLSAAAECGGKVCSIQILGTDNNDKTFAVNQALADKIGIKTGGTLSLRFLPPQTVPAESSLGRKDQLIRTQIHVDTIIPNHGIGRFSLKADQQAEPLLLVPLDFLQQKLKIGNKVNAVFFMGEDPLTVSTPEQRKKLEQQYRPTLDDMGIVTEIHHGQHYITSARMLFTPPQVDAILKALCLSKEAGTSAPITTGLLYLTTSIKAVKNGRETPYSTVYATDEGQSADSEQWAAGSEENIIALNQWTADDLDAVIGDVIELTWFDPDDVNVTKSQRFRLTKILPMEGLGADPNVVPAVKGFTDEAAISDWDPPFPFDAKKIRQKDEDYWDKYRAAPKAFVPLVTGQKLFGSRFGNVTTIVTGERTPAALSASHFPLPAFGLNFVPVKEQGLTASVGTTPFAVLFLAFSFFIIASALMLVIMLFQLAVEMKAKQIGILLAVGWSPFSVTKMLLAEGFVITFIGSFFGVFFGIFYAKLMIYGLTTWWLDAVTVPFLTLFVNPNSLFIGFVSGIMLAMLTIALTLRKIVKLPVNQLLCGAGIIVPVSLTKRKKPIRSLMSFAVSNSKRNPARSTRCTALIAFTVFLVLVVGAFRLDPQRKDTGCIAETALPVYADITTPEGREKLSIQPDDEKYIAAKNSDEHWCGFRMKDGDSTSCLNLYQTGNPRILGVPRKFSMRHALFFDLTAPSPTAAGVIPVILDKNTAQYSLHLYGGIGEVFTLPQDRTIRCKVVGLLKNSVFQGEIMMSEENLLKLFPEVAGYRYFVFDGSLPMDDRTAKILYETLGDYGFQMEAAKDRLRKLFAIQNTYLSTFQSLGGIGLLLGTFGFAVIQFRNVFERRKELALFSAVGFTKSKIILLLLYENMQLLFRGLFLGVFCSLVSLLPIIFKLFLFEDVNLSMYFQTLLWLTGGMVLIALISNVAAALAVLKIPIARELAEER